MTFPVGDVVEVDAAMTRPGRLAAPQSEMR